MDESCGYRVPVEDKGEGRIVEELAAQILKWSSCRKTWLALAMRALEKAAETSWQATVEGAYSHVKPVISRLQSVELPQLARKAIDS